MTVDLRVSNELIETIGRDEIEQQLSILGEVVGSRPGDPLADPFSTTYSLDVADLPPGVASIMPTMQRYRDGAEWKTRVLNIECYDSDGNIVARVEA